VSADVAATPAATPDRERDLQPSTPDSVVEPLALAGSAGPSRPPFAIQRQELLRELASLEGAEAGSARLRLARLFLADALGAEALAVLDAATPDWPGKEGGTPRREVALRAAAEFLLGRERRASELLATIPGSGDAELALWRAAAAAALEKWDEAARELTSAGNVWAEYPPRLRFRLGLAVADALGQAGRVDPALAAADKLAQYPASRVERSRLSLLRLLSSPVTAVALRLRRLSPKPAGRGDLAIKVLARFLDTVSGLERITSVNGV
jgi:hypothetical protein